MSKLNGPHTIGVSLSVIDRSPEAHHEPTDNNRGLENYKSVDLEIYFIYTDHKTSRNAQRDCSLRQPIVNGFGILTDSRKTYRTDQKDLSRIDGQNCTEKLYQCAHWQTFASALTHRKYKVPDQCQLGTLYRHVMDTRTCADEKARERLAQFESPGFTEMVEGFHAR